MKKILAFVLMSVVMVSCYDSYIYDNAFSSIFFAYPLDVRTVVVGEGMKFDVGVALGGVRENTSNRTVTYTLDNSLITPAKLAQMKAAPQAYIKNPSSSVTALQQLPSNYYTISDPQTMVIKAGQHSGGVTVRPDSVAFLNDSLKTMYSTYALPFRITAADADSIPYLLKTSVVGVRFENMLWGNYWHGGAALVNRPGKPDTTVIYKTTIPAVEAKIWVLTTKGPNSLYVNGYLDQVTGRQEMTLVLKGSNVYLSNNTVAAGKSTYAFTPEGVSTFNRAKLLQNRKIFLKYTYLNTSNGYTYHCTDTLTFRNRMRDGINEWQDENPSHYTK